MQYNHTIDLDMMRRQSVEIVTHQYDDAGRAVRIRVLADGEPATLPANADIRYSVSKPDGTFCTGVCSTVTEDNKTYVVFTLTYQMLVLPGRETIDISIRADGASISTMTFINHIQRAAVQDGDVESSSEFDELQVALQRMDEIRELKEDAEQAVVDAQAVAAGIQSERDQIATNTTNIATNTRSIGTNANNIATNANNIATNAAGISDLDDEVAQLKDDLNYRIRAQSVVTNVNITYLDSSLFANGDVNSNGIHVKPDVRRVVTHIITFVAPVTISILKGYYVMCHTYAADGTYIGNDGWKTNSDKINLEAGQFVRFCIRRATETADALSPETAATVIALKNRAEFTSIIADTYSYSDIALYPSMAEQIIFTVGSNYALNITVPSRLYFSKATANSSPFTTIIPEVTSFTVGNNDYLVFDTTDNTIKVVNAYTFNTNKPRYVILVWNHYGNVKGAWYVYWLYQKNTELAATVDKTTSISPETFTMEICCRQGQVDGYPENTLQGGKRAKEFGYNRLRVSVVWTSDGVPICAHLDKVAGSTLRTKDGEQVTDESLYLSNMTYEDIATNYDAGIYKGDNFKGIYVPTLESMIKQCKRLNQTLVIEYKAGYTSARMQALLETLAKYAMTDKSTYSTTHSEQIAEVGSMTYKIPCYLIAHLSLEQVNLAIQSGAVALSFFSDDTYSLEAVLRARENGLALRTGSFSTIAAAETFLEWCDGFEFYNIKNPVRALITA